MKFPYSAKGCSHCDLRQVCDLKISEANVDESFREIREGQKVWWTMCKDFFREVRE